MVRKNRLTERSGGFLSEEVRVNSEEVRGAKMRRRKNYKDIAKPIPLFLRMQKRRGGRL